MNFINTMKKIIKKDKKIVVSDICSNCKGYGRVSDKESCEVCQGTGVKK